MLLRARVTRFFSTPGQIAFGRWSLGWARFETLQSEWWWMTMRWRLLAICSAENLQAVESAIAQWSLKMTCCSTVQESRRRLRRGSYGLIFCEAKLPRWYKDVVRLLGLRLIGPVSSYCQIRSERLATVSRLK